MAVVKIIELIGTSSTSSDDAVQQALKEAQSTLRNIKAVDLVSTGLRGDNLNEWRAHVRVAFLIDSVILGTQPARRGADRTVQRVNSLNSIRNLIVSSEAGKPPKTAKGSPEWRQRRRPGLQKLWTTSPQSSRRRALRQR